MRQLVVVTLLVGGCGPTLLKPTEGDPDQLYIFHGAPPDAAYHQATVSLHRASGWSLGEPMCSGTLISDRWVLTAAHCVPGVRASELYVHFGPDGFDIDPERLHGARRIVVHPSYDSRQIVNDVALIELTDPVTHTAPVMPLPASLGLTSADRGKSIDLAGFGYQEDGGYGVLMHVEVPIAAVRSTQIEYDQGNGWSGNGGTCNGDSGGPAFFERNGHVYVAGVTSYGDARCVDFGVSAKVDAYEGFIESTTGINVAPVTGGSSSGSSGSSSSGSSGAVPQTSTYSGWLNQGYLVSHSYTSLGAGTHDVLLVGPSGADFDLYFAESINGQWVYRAESASSSNVERLRVTVPNGGRFAVSVGAYAGSGAYAIEVTRPQ
jgi:secreted trypsin-like serine protease